jgi:23S rRNA (pseudouridine1915-N3)-methyltransferase
MGRLRIIAVGSRMPKWVREPFDDYIHRLGPGLKISLTEIAPGPRTAGQPPAKAIETEGQRILAAVRAGEYVVALDERGTEMTTRELASWLARQLQESREVPTALRPRCWPAATSNGRSHGSLSRTR